jgi:hypothetical protein
LNRQGGSNLQDKFLINLVLPLQNANQMCQYICAARAEKNILSQLYLFVKTFPINPLPDGPRSNLTLFSKAYSSKHKRAKNL